MEMKIEELTNCVSSRNPDVIRTEGQGHVKHTSEERQETGCPAVLSSTVSACTSELELSSSSASTKVVSVKSANHGLTNVVSVQFT